MQQSAIKSYDVRGIVGKDFIEQDTYFFVRALLDFLQKQHTESISKIIIGYDHRSTSDVIQQFVVQACVDFGVQNIFLLQVPTPVLQFALYQGYADVGIMITASHNPLQYNGLKLWYKKQSLQGAVLQEIWKSMSVTDYDLPVLQKIACIQNSEFILQAYYDVLDTQFSDLKNMQYKILCMASGGPVQAFLEHCKQKFAWDFVDIVGCKKNKECIVFNPDPTSKETQSFIQDILLKKQYDCVLAFDGDADRLVVYSSVGHMLSGDVLGYIFAQCNNYDSVVMDIKTSGGLIHLLEKIQTRVILAPTGCADIKKAIAREQAMFGCEVSGHYFFAAHQLIDDGLYAALQFLRHAVQNGSVQAVLDCVPQLYDSIEYRLPLHAVFNPAIVQDLLEKKIEQELGGTISLVDGIRYQTEKAWFIMRASKTEPVLSLRYGVFDVHYKPMWTTMVKKCIKPFIAQAIIEKYEW